MVSNLQRMKTFRTFPGIGGLASLLENRDLEEHFSVPKSSTAPISFLEVPSGIRSSKTAEVDICS